MTFTKRKSFYILASSKIILEESSRMLFSLSSIILFSRTVRDGKRESGTSSVPPPVGFTNISTGYDLYDAELDVRKEKRTQRYLVFMVAVFAVSLCPLMVLR